MHQAICVICKQDFAEVTCMICATPLEDPCEATLEEPCTALLKGAAFTPLEEYVKPLQPLKSCVQSQQPSMGLNAAPLGMKPLQILWVAVSILCRCFKVLQIVLLRCSPFGICMQCLLHTSSIAQLGSSVQPLYGTAYSPSGQLCTTPEGPLGTTHNPCSSLGYGAIPTDPYGIM